MTKKFEKSYVVVTDFIDLNLCNDVSEGLQKIIDENPNRTIYFPDGKYYISKPLITPADPKLSVSLKLSAYAQIIATANWNGDGALVRLGGKNFANDIRTCGSNYFFDGGILDGSGVADGISIDGGRETVIRNVSIKHTRIGLCIKNGANSGSSDADIFGVNIVGNGKKDSIGILIEGCDNTLANMRIADVYTGVRIKSAGNMLRNIHPLYTLDFNEFENSCGFLCENHDNWFDFCYSDQFAIGFSLNNSAVLQNCFCYWYSPREKQHIGIKATRFDCIVNNFTIGFNGAEARNAVVQVAEKGGKGILQNLIINDKALLKDNTHEEYLHGVVI